MDIRHLASASLQSMQWHKYSQWMSTMNKSTQMQLKLHIKTLKLNSGKIIKAALMLMVNVDSWTNGVSNLHAWQHF